MSPQGYHTGLSAALLHCIMNGPTEYARKILTQNDIKWCLEMRAQHADLLYLNASYPTIEELQRQADAQYKPEDYHLAPPHLSGPLWVRYVVAETVVFVLLLVFAYCVFGPVFKRLVRCLIAVVTHLMILVRDRFLQ